MGLIDLDLYSNRQIKRLKEQIKELKTKHKGKETSIYTYHAGYDLGYLEGKLAAIESIQGE